MRPGLEPAASRSADRHLSNWANRAAVIVISIDRHRNAVHCLLFLIDIQYR